jgi:hypothetical protein
VVALARHLVTGIVHDEPGGECTGAPTLRLAMPVHHVDHVVECLALQPRVVVCDLPDDALECAAPLGARC